MTWSITLVRVELVIVVGMTANPVRLTMASGTMPENAKEGALGAKVAITGEAAYGDAGFVSFTCIIHMPFFDQQVHAVT